MSRWLSSSLSFPALLKREQIFTLRLAGNAGGKPKQLTRFSSGLIDYADYSPDGKRFIVSRAFGDNEVVLIKNFK